MDNDKLANGFTDISLFIIKNDFVEMNDLIVIDTIYSFALSYFNNDHSEALLALTFACLPFSKMPLRFPIFNIPIDLQLPTIQPDLFQKKVDKLPSHFLIDSPKSKFGDKDKISHFFGNAFIKYNFAFFNFASFMGAFVEIFEGAFKIDGAVDHRDLYINKFGELFGIALKENPKILPSRILSLSALNYIIISR
ncbi:MAG: hypothetical protein K8F60_14860 [Melioribacteraceae bacterium]|nr:hypothetical protein [Melioribacteraceae bacterium]